MKRPPKDTWLYQNSRWTCVNDEFTIWERSIKCPNCKDVILCYKKSTHISDIILLPTPAYEPYWKYKCKHCDTELYSYTRDENGKPWFNV